MTSTHIVFHQFVWRHMWFLVYFICFARRVYLQANHMHCKRFAMGTWSPDWGIQLFSTPLSTIWKRARGNHKSCPPSLYPPKPICMRIQSRTPPTVCPDANPSQAPIPRQAIFNISTKYAYPRPIATLWLHNFDLSSSIPFGVQGYVLFWLREGRWH